MPVNDRKRPQFLVDTSAAVALVVEDHVAHDATAAALRGVILGLSGHAFFETYSVLTRLPGDARRSPSDVASILATNFPRSLFLGSEQTATLSTSLPELGIAGAAVYDALVGATAAHHRLPLATRDARALKTYRALDVDVRLIT